MKIGLYTLHSSNNVGAMLQAYATITILQQLGADVEIVNIYTREEELRNHHNAPTSIFRSFARKVYKLSHPGILEMESRFDAFHISLPLSSRYYSQEDYILSPKDYDIHLVGSDQVWNLEKGYNHSRFFFLDYLPDNSVRMSLASSFGTTSHTTDGILAGNALKKFNRISVREDVAVDFVKAISGQSSMQILDPTLILDSKQWNEVIDDEPLVKGEYIFFYGVNSDQNTWNIISLAKSYLGIPVVGYPGPLPPQYKFDKFIYNGGPKEFVNLIKNASLVITSSFHGLAFALNYGKRFMVVNYGNRMERMESLIRVINAYDCIVDSQSTAKEVLKKESSSVSYSNRLLINRQNSLEWIHRNIINYR